MKFRKNIVGNKYGKWKVLSFHHIHKTSKWKTYYYECVCECGKIKLVDRDSLRKGTSKCCGCRKFKIGFENPSWKGYEEISGSYFIAIKHGAKRRNIKFDISKEELWKIFLNQKKKCALSELPLCFPPNRKSYHLGNASLDRIDSSKDYIVDNIQWVHKDLQTMKMALNQKEFINYCRLVTNKFKNNEIKEN